jgi:MarR family transcriptional regulator, lower aerobic nicotinate degradation pathway regulator
MAQLPVVNQSAHHPGALIDHLARRMRLRAEAVLAPLGLRPRHLVALTVLRDRGGSTQQALAATLEMDGTNIVGLLNELEARELIERRRSPEDRRRHLVELTGAGAEQLAKAEGTLSAVEDEVLGVLDETQRETLYNLLQQTAAGTVVSCATKDISAPARRVDETGMRLRTRRPRAELSPEQTLLLVGVAEDEGFEPSRACTQHAFQACAIGH